MRFVILHTNFDGDMREDFADMDCAPIPLAGINRPDFMQARINAVRECVKLADCSCE